MRNSVSWMKYNRRGTMTVETSTTQPYTVSKERALDFHWVSCFLSKSNIHIANSFRWVNSLLDVIFVCLYYL